MTRRTAISLAFLFAILAPTPGWTQVLAPPVPQHTVDLGFVYKWYHRDMEPESPRENQWEVGTIYGRFGVFEWLTLSFEGAISNVEHEDFPDLVYRRYAVGAGATAALLTFAGFDLDATLQVNDVWDQDYSENEFHKRTHGVVASIFVARTIGAGDFSFDLWAGPVYANDYGDNYPWGAREPVRNESVDNVGVLAGASVLAWRHILLTGSVDWINYSQVRLAAAVRFGGGE